MAPFEYSFIFQKLHEKATTIEFTFLHYCWIRCIWDNYKCNSVLYLVVDYYWGSWYLMIILWILLWLVNLWDFGGYNLYISVIIRILNGRCNSFQQGDSKQEPVLLLSEWQKIRWICIELENWWWRKKLIELRQRRRRIIMWKCFFRWCHRKQE